MQLQRELCLTECRDVGAAKRDAFQERYPLDTQCQHVNKLSMAELLSTTQYAVGRLRTQASVTASIICRQCPSPARGTRSRGVAFATGRGCRDQRSWLHCTFEERQAASASATGLVPALIACHWVRRITADTRPLQLRRDRNMRVDGLIGACMWTMVES